jgi:hypothetical protein
VQEVLCEALNLLDFAAHHPTREIQKIALAESVRYIQENMTTAIGTYTPRQVLDIALKHVAVDGHFVEFGVFRGGTIRYISSKMSNRIVHGFDSFEGLPESWAGYIMDKGTFSLGGKTPRVPGNVRLHKGWFDASLPLWLGANPGTIAFVHIDCDIYSSTKTIFELIANRITAGTVIVFDEYLGYPRWQHHEFKAFQEFVSANKVKYEYLAFARIQVAIKILSLDAPPNAGVTPVPA